MNKPTGWILRPEDHWAPGDWDYLVNGELAGTTFPANSGNGQWFWGTYGRNAQKGYADTPEEGRAEVERALRAEGLL